MSQSDEINKFLKSFQENSEKLRSGLLKAINVSTIELKDVIQSLTPVGKPSIWKTPAKPGYVPGTLKAAWGIKEEGENFTIFNDTIYAMKVEYGAHSTQAPNGMVRVGMLQFPDILKNNITKYVAK